jgi:hypothetical protein
MVQVVFLIITGACSKSQTTPQNKINGLVQEEIVIEDEIKDNILVSDSDELKETERLTTIKYNMEDFSLNLIDWNKKEIVKSILLEENEYVFKSFELNQGYACLVLVGETPVEDINELRRCSEKVFRIYDAELNQLNEINLAEVFPSVIEARHWVTDISLDGNKIAWGSLQNLYVYDIKDDSVITTYGDSNPQSLIFYDIEFDDEGRQIVYYSGDGETSTSYGIVDIHNGNMINFHEDNYINANEINISGQFGCITDVVNGFTGKSSGKVMILDLENSKVSTLKVEGEESTCARITEDGKYLIVANGYNVEFYVRQYDVESGTLIKEEKYPSFDNMFGGYTIIQGPDSINYYILGTGDEYIIECFELDCQEE